MNDFLAPYLEREVFAAGGNGRLPDGTAAYSIQHSINLRKRQGEMTRPILGERKPAGRVPGRGPKRRAGVPKERLPGPSPMDKGAILPKNQARTPLCPYISRLSKSRIKKIRSDCRGMCPPGRSGTSSGGRRGGLRPGPGFLGAELHAFQKRLLSGPGQQAAQADRGRQQIVPHARVQPVQDHADHGAFVVSD